MSHPDPPCFHSNYRVQDWDNGADPDTGYHDSGTMVTCRDCNEQFTDEEFSRILADIERDQHPESGDVYTQLGARIVIIDAGGDDVFYSCRLDGKMGPPRSVTLEYFQREVSQGLLARVRERV
jgi:hypothetical protein